MKKGLIALRDYSLADRNFIFSTWLRGLRYGNEVFNFINSEIYFRFYQQVIESILGRPGISIKIACLKEDPEVILGYSVSEKDVLHYIFVKTSWRRIGIANDLVPKNLSTVTHITSVGKSILIKKYPHVIFNPFL